MLDAIKKKFFSNEKVTEDMAKEDITQAALAVNTEMAAQLKLAQDTLAAQAADMQALTEMVEEMSAAMASTKDALAAAQAEKATLAEQAAATRLEARTSAITTAVGTSQLETLLAATNSMDDAQFDVVIGALAKSFETEAKSAMFKEMGVSAAAEAPEEDAGKRLAAKMAAQLKLNN